MNSKSLLALLLTTLVILITGSQNTLVGQGFYKEAYILQQQDTVSGQIEWTDEKALSLGIRFKAAGDTTTHYFDTSHLEGFGFSKENLHFKAVPVSIRVNGTPTETKRFAKVWLRGVTNLYKVALQVEEHEQNHAFYYILQKDEAFYTLAKFKSSIKGTQYVQNRYHGMLKALFQDCAGITASEIEKTAFNDKDLLELVKTYNACKNPQIATQELANGSKAIVRHGIESSFSRYYSPGDENILNSQGYSLGFFWDVMEPDLSRRVSSVIGVNYLYMHYYNKDVNFSRFPLNEPKRNAYNDRHYIRIPLLLQYNFNKSFEEKVQPFINFGVTSILLPKFTYGAGTYLGNWKIYAQVENLGLSFNDYKIISFALGYKMPRKSNK